MRFKVRAVLLSAVAMFGVYATDSALAQSKAEIEQMKAKLAEVMRQQTREMVNLDNFDDLDFNVYNNQRWEMLGKSHAKDIVVHYPDGSITKGLDEHVAMMKPMFVFAPDVKIVDHPIRIASGNWTSVMGGMTGTFSKPMPFGQGKTIPPTGKTFKFNMVTIGRWEGDTMAEEWLFYDNLDFMKQIGVAP